MNRFPCDVRKRNTERYLGRSFRPMGCIRFYLRQSNLHLGSNISPQASKSGPVTKLIEEGYSQQVRINANAAEIKTKAQETPWPNHCTVSHKEPIRTGSPKQTNVSLQRTLLVLIKPRIRSLIDTNLKTPKQNPKIIPTEI